MSLSNTNILLCVTGSVAAIRTPPLISILQSLGATVKLVPTPAALPFLTRESPLPPNTPIHTDTQEAALWTSLGDPVLHIDLRDWAHLLLIAPLSANSLAKLASGLCDNLVTCVARAWQVPHAGPFLVAPAMNDQMWTHPVTESHLSTLRTWGIVVIPPLTKRLACGATGPGAMQHPQHIAHVVAQHVARLHDPVSLPTDQQVPGVEGEGEVVHGPAG